MNKVLIADDDAAVRAVVRTTLGDEAYEIVEACDGDEALQLAREHVPDVVLLDVMMPRRSGLDVCRALKADPRTSRIVVVMLTGKSLHDERDAGVDVGADAYFTKPFSPVALLRRVEDVLHGSGPTGA
ncbi:MAG TPA: response regulator [Actinomycetota bacterium]|nr:response regulator [Actinomycetota bacterium]